MYMGLYGTDMATKISGQNAVTCYAFYRLGHKVMKKITPMCFLSVRFSFEYVPTRN